MQLQRLRELAPARLADTTLDDVEDDDSEKCSPFGLVDLWAAADEWRMWAEIADDTADDPVVPAEDMQSHPAGAIKLVYASKQRLPIWLDGSGNGIAVDFDPGPAGKVGQVICYGSDDCDDMAVFGDSVTAFLRNCRALFERDSNVSDLVAALRAHLHNLQET